MLPSDTVGGNTTYFQSFSRWITLGGKMIISLTRGGTKVICPLRVMVPLEDILKTGDNLPLQGEKNANKQTDRQTNKQTNRDAKKLFPKFIPLDSVVTY